MLRPLALLAVLALLLVGAGNAQTLKGWMDNLVGSTLDEMERLDGALTALRITSDKLMATAGDRDSVLLLVRDAERTARAADALSRKAERLAELADQLATEVGAPD